MTAQAPTAGLDFRPLTRKQQLFVSAYLLHLNAAEAASQAGYKGNRNTLQSVGVENLLKPAVAQAVAIALQARSERVEIDQDWVLEQLKLIRESPPHLQQHTRAVELLGKHLGMFVERHEVQVSLVNLLDEALAANQAREQRKELPPGEAVDAPARDTQLGEEVTDD